MPSHDIHTYGYRDLLTLTGAWSATIKAGEETQHLKELVNPAPSTARLQMEAIVNALKATPTDSIVRFHVIDDGIGTALAYRIHEWKKRGWKYVHYKERWRTVVGLLETREVMVCLHPSRVATGKSIEPRTISSGFNEAFQLASSLIWETCPEMSPPTSPSNQMPADLFTEHKPLAAQSIQATKGTANI